MLPCYRTVVRLEQYYYKLVSKCSYHLLKISSCPDITSIEWRQHGRKEILRRATPRQMMPSNAEVKTSVAPGGAYSLVFACLRLSFLVFPCLRLSSRLFACFRSPSLVFARFRSSSVVFSRLLSSSLGFECSSWHGRSSSRVFTSLRVCADFRTTAPTTQSIL